MSPKPNVRLILLLTGMCFALTSCSRVAAKSEPVENELPVRAVRADVRDVPLEITAVGNVEAAESVAVKSRIAGQVEHVAFAEGQSVTKGQLLFSIDRDALQGQVSQQQAELVRDAAMENQARAIVVRDGASERQSRSEAEIAVQLGKLGVLSGQRVDQMLTVHDTASASQNSDRAAVDAAVATRKADQARLAQTQLQLSFTQVVAPIAGRAGAAMVKVGTVVGNDGATLVNLLQIAPIDVTFGVPEQVLPEVQRLNAHQPLSVTANFGPAASSEGRLTFIDNTVDATTGSIRLKAIFPNTDGALWPGEFVHVRLRLGIDSSKTVIPSAAIQDGLNGKYVWLIRSNRASMTPVTVARTYLPENGPEQAVVQRGIGRGDLVVTQGQLRLTPGARVSLLNAADEAVSGDRAAE